MNPIDCGNGVIGGLTCRNMKESDDANYCDMYIRVFSRPPWNEEWSLSEVRHDLERIKSKKTFMGITAESGLVNAGFITGFRLCRFCFPEDIYYLQELFVEPGMQGCGIGGLLLERLTKLLESRGTRFILLLTRQGTAAEKFYLKKGYKRLFNFIRIKGKSIYFKKI